MCDATKNCNTQTLSTINIVEGHLIKDSMAISRNLKNAVIAFLVPLPSILLYLSFLKHYDSSIATTASDPSNFPSKFASFWSTLYSWCYHHPLLLANALFFLNVNALFWVIGQIQSSHWVHTKFPLKFTFCFLGIFKVDIFSLLSVGGCCRWLTRIGRWYQWCLFTTMQATLWLSMIGGGLWLWWCWLGCGVWGSLITTSGEKGGNGVPERIGVSLRWASNMETNGGGFPSLLSMSPSRSVFLLLFYFLIHGCWMMFNEQVLALILKL